MRTCTTKLGIVVNIQRRKVNKVAFRGERVGRMKRRKRGRRGYLKSYQRRRIEQSGHNSHDKNDDKKGKKRFGETNKMECERGIRDRERARGRLFEGYRMGSLASSLPSPRITQSPNSPKQPVFRSPPPFLHLFVK